MNNILRAAVKVGLTIAAVFIVAKIMNKKPALPHTYRKPGRCRNYRYPANWKGTPIDRKGRFVNHRSPFYQNYVHILKWIPGHVYNLFRNYRYLTPVIKQPNNDFLNKHNILVWLGHASFYMHFGGKRILLDPQFFNTTLYKRHSEPPIDPTYFTSIDYILLSHDHADHLDRRSITLLVKQNPDVIILTGLNMEKLLRKYIKVNTLKIYCADWFEVFPLAAQSPEIVFVPARHYSKRVDTGFNKSLWGGFIIRSLEDNIENRNIYYGGDSGSDNHFEMMKEFEPNIAILGIGAFKPVWFMKPNHMSPKEAIEACKATGAQLLIPMHYGTFNLSYEHMSKPLKELKKHQGSLPVKTPAIGEIIYL